MDRLQNPIKIIGAHINLGNARAANIQLNQSIINNQYTFLSLNEPYTYDNKITSIPRNYKIIAHDNSLKAAIIIKDHIDCQVVFINKLLVIIDIQSSLLNCLLISIYCPPRKNLQQHLSTLQAWIEIFPNHQIILLGDFNAKSCISGKRNTDERGNQLLHSCISLDLSIENNPEMLPTFDSTRGQSWIDLITKNLDGHIKLEVVDEIFNSDHNILQVTWTPELFLPKDMQNPCYNPIQLAYHKKRKFILL
ncbi:hypothetical protein CDAR_617221 [Caerostris darwini]|uniref:Endonuclease/exonuclease/phosphatase domain-containing protein n=1 Tax=Caerostris darwini TaxID=1538125 RepID=A0AAV4NVT2_9ARAC|nr:hypothetical protein CDAR_617221 [Caerostris darwini]